MIAFVGKFKVVALALSLSSFIPQCLGITNFTYAQGARGMEQSAKGIEHPDEIADAFHGTSSAYGVGRFEEILEELQVVCDGVKEKISQSKSLQFEKEILKQRKAELLELDKKIKEEFKATEEFLKDKKVSRALNKHKDFVKSYEKKFKTLIAEITELIDTENTEKLTAEAAKFTEFLKQSEVKEPKIEFKPEKLPHRNLPVRNLPTEEYTPPEIPKIELKKEYKEKLEKEKQKGIRKSENTDDTDKKMTQMTQIDCSGLIPELVCQSLPRIQYGEQAYQTDFFNHCNQMALDYDNAIACAGNITPFLFMQMPDSQYLMPTLEVQFTPEIESLANALGKDPVKIYEYVRNNVDYEPYYGSLKGAQGTFWEMSGNDFDQASLLIALLRISGVPARYVYGKVIIPIEKVMNWVGGVKDPLIAGQIIASNGIPAVFLQTGGKIVAVKIEHCWVEISTSYDIFMGIPQKTGKDLTWIPLDPSFKEYRYKEGIDITEAVIFNEESYMDSVMVISPVEYYKQQIIEYLEDNMPGVTIDSVYRTRAIKPVKLGILPLTSPYQIHSVLSKFEEIVDEKRHKIIFQVLNTFGEIDFEVSLRMPEVSCHRVTLSWMPATPSDEALAEQYGGMYFVPAYMLSVKPVLRVEGEIKDSGSAIGMGYSQKFTIQFISPAGWVDEVQNEVTAGAYYAVGLNFQKISSQFMERRIDMFLNYPDLTDTPNYNNSDRDGGAGELLYDLALFYFAKMDSAYEFSDRIFQMQRVNEVWEGTVAFDLTVAYMFGLPYRIEVNKLAMDMDRLVCNIFEVNGKQEKSRKFMILCGMASSFWEHRVIEDFYGVAAISAVKSLQIAKASGVTVHHIDIGNAGQIIPQLEIDASVKAQLWNAVNTGKEASVSQTNIQLERWIGVGYIIRDPVKGEGSYLILGNIAGGEAGIIYVNVVTGAPPTGWPPHPNAAWAILCLGMDSGGFKGWIEYSNGLKKEHLIEIADILYGAGYNVAYARVKTKEQFMELLSQSTTSKDIFYYFGHGKNGDLLIHPPSNELISPADIEMDIKLVFLNGCQTYEQVNEWKTSFHIESEGEAFVGRRLMARFNELRKYANIFWNEMAGGASVEEAVSGIHENYRYSGDPDTRLDPYVP